MRLWDPAGTREGRIVGRQAGFVFDVALLPDLRIVSGGPSGAVRLWDCLRCQSFGELLAAARARIPTEPIPGDP